MDTINKRDLLINYKDLFTEYITGKDIKKISEDTGISKSTIYTYINGGIPDNDESRKKEDIILSECKKILIERGEMFLNLVKS